ncbi:MAG: hypothetical protein GOU99_00905 [Candidatus Altiarchaeota archaeon]|nr:hypothetical protein [Candidatus Altiarchaeota archaeon]
MIGATMAGAVAANLGDLPAPFVENSQLNSQIVIGANAAVADVIAAAQVSAALGEYMISAVSTGGATTVSGGTQDEDVLGAAVYIGLGKYTFKDNDIPKLQDTEISFSDDTFDIHEEVILGQTNLKLVTGVGTSDMSGINDADTYGSDVASKTYMKVTEDDITYKYVFDDNVPVGDIDTTHLLKINFLGSQLEISAATESNNATSGVDEVTVSIGTEYVLAQGATAVVDAKTVTVDTIGDSSVALSISGSGCSDTDFVSSGSTWETSCGVDVKVESILYVDAGHADNKVKVSIGTDITKTYKHGEAYIGYEDEDTPTWVWDILIGVDDKIDSIGVAYNLDITSLDDSPISVGGELALPGDFVVLRLVDYNTDTYGQFDVKIDSSEKIYDAAGTNLYVSNLPVLIFDGPEDDSFAGGSWESEKIAIHLNATGAYIGYWDTDKSKWLYHGKNETNTIGGGLNFTANWDTAVNIVQDDSIIDVYLRNAGYPTSVDAEAYLDVSGHADTLIIDPADDLSSLGATANQAESGEVTLGGIDISTYKTDVRSNYGIVLLNPDSNGDTDKVKFQVPDEQVKVNVYLGDPTGGATASAADITYTYAPITTEVAVMDSEASTTQPMIVIGGPGINSLAQQLLGSRETSFEEWKTFFGYDDATATGKGVIKVYDAADTPWTQPAVLIAGWEAKDTRAAGYIFAKYLSQEAVSEWDSKTKVVISGETVTGSTVSSTE